MQFENNLNILINNNHFISLWSGDSQKVFYGVETLAGIPWDKAGSLTKKDK